MMTEERKLCKVCLVWGKPDNPGSPLTFGDAFETDEELFNHLEMDHDLVVVRPGETREDALKRVLAKNKRIGTPGCRCLTCMMAHRLSGPRGMET